MEKLQIKVTYIEIVGEVVLLVVFSDLQDVLDNIVEIKKSVKENQATCLVLDGPINGTQYKDFISSMNFKDLRYGWYTDRVSMPYMAGVVDYIKVDGIVFYNANHDMKKTLWVPSINNISKSTLDPLDPYYFEKLDELSNKQGT